MPGELIEISEARRRVLERVPKPVAEEVPLRSAVGRVLVVPIAAGEDVPGFDNSAMDGYAVRAADLAGAREGPVTLEIAGESRAGRPAELQLGAGEAIAISTGAMVPAGADTVVRVEDTTSADGRVTISAVPRSGANIRRAGEDIRAGEPVLAAGTEIGAAEAGVLASLDVDPVRCARRPGVAVLITGDELREPGEPLEPGTIRDSNAYSVPALAAEAGAEVEEIVRVRDDFQATRDAIGSALEDAGVVVICGGVSVGEHDHVKRALAALGVEEAFWGIALRPGKPTWFGVAPQGSLVLGLPGNPVSAMVTFLLLARPALRSMQGADPAATRGTAVLDSAYPKKPGRAHAVRCRLRLDADGWHAEPTKEQGSHVLTSMLGADALALLPSEAAEVPAGATVEIELLRATLG